MLQFLNKLMALKRDEKGVTALEYGLIAALIAVAIISGVTTLGGAIGSTFTNIGTKFSASAISAPSNTK